MKNKKCPVCGGEVCPQEDLGYEDVDLCTGKKTIIKPDNNTLACMECAWFEEKGYLN